MILRVTTKRIYPLFVVSTLMVLGAGCGSSSTSFSGDEYTSDHFEYRYRSNDMTVCPEILETLEHHLITIGARLEWGKLPKITYLKYFDEEDFKRHAQCESESDGCATASKVNSYKQFSRHELIHSYVLEQWGDSVGLLSEGLAVGLSCEPIVPEELELVVADWRNALHFRLKLDRLEYMAAGRFVAYLLSEMGVSKFKLFYQSVSDNSSESDVATAFEKVYGRSLDSEWAAASNFAQVCLGDWPCAGQQKPMGTFNIGATCAGDNAKILSLSPNGNIIDVTGASLMMLSCSSDGIPPLLDGGESVASGLALEATVTNWFEPGIGSAVAVVPYGAGYEQAPQRTVHWSEAQRDFTSNQCNGEGRVNLLDNRETTIALRNGTNQRFIRLSSSTTRRFMVYFNTANVRISGAICDGCSSDNICVAYDSAEWADLPIGPNSVLRVDSVLGSRFAQFRFVPIE